MKIKHIMSYLFLIFFTVNLCYADKMRAPVLPLAKTNKIKQESYTTLSRQYGYTFLVLYQHNLGLFIKSDCPMEPSCSNYSIDAINSYGLIKGVILTADRLLHETDEAYMVPKNRIKGRGFCCIDPVSRNVLWKTKHKNTPPKKQP